MAWTHAQNTASKVATFLALEANTNGQANLVTTLNSLATEISSESLDANTFDRYIQTWSLLLSAAGSAIFNNSHNGIEANTNSIKTSCNTVATEITTIDDNILSIKTSANTIATEIVTIDNHLDRIQDTIEDTETTCTEEGPHFRTVSGQCLGSHDSELSRAMMVTSLRATGKLDEVIDEIENPTELGHLGKPRNHED